MWRHIPLVLALSFLLSLSAATELYEEFGSVADVRLCTRSVTLSKLPSGHAPQVWSQGAFCRRINHNAMIETVSRRDVGIKFNKFLPIFFKGCTIRRLRGGADLVMVTFLVQIRAKYSKLGDSVLLLGNNHALGKWDRGRAIELTTTNHSFWKAEVPMPVGACFNDDTITFCCQ